MPYVLSDFDFELPKAQIAQMPLAKRTASRLFCVDREQSAFRHAHFHQLLDLIQPNDLLVFNNTKVIPARLFGQKETGGKIECLVERLLSEHTCFAHIRSSKSPKPGSRLKLENAFEVEVSGREGELFILHSEQPLLPLLESHGHIPLPPYINRLPEQSDKLRYQTIYAKTKGAVAAPTAGLHFDEGLLNALKGKGVRFAELTLHVGAGTFQPVREEDLSRHQMHSEWMEVSPEACAEVKACRERGGRVIAVGTTSVRALETAGNRGELKAYQGDTDIFITPGFPFQVVDALITNFHLPKSTLMMLVSALGGYGLIMQAYREAVAEGYRFFSYGDAMFIY